MSPSSAFVSDREREILAAVARLATSNPFLPDRIEQRVHFLAGRIIESAEWFVQAQHTGTGRQRPAERDALPFPPAEPRSPAIE